MRLLRGASAAPSASPYPSEVATAAPEYPSAAVLAAALGAPSAEDAEHIRVRMLGPELAARSAALYYDGSEEAADCSDEDDDRTGFTDVEVVQRLTQQVQVQTMT